jgi:NADPH2:quinone reductase
MPPAIQIRQTGGPEVLHWTPIEVGEPGPGQVRLRQAAFGPPRIGLRHHARGRKRFPGYCLFYAAVTRGSA